jgi:hypothetical protein
MIRRMAVGYKGPLYIKAPNTTPYRLTPLGEAACREILDFWLLIISNVNSKHCPPDCGNHLFVLILDVVWQGYGEFE